MHAYKLKRWSPPRIEQIEQCKNDPVAASYRPGASAKRNKEETLNGVKVPHTGSKSGDALDNLYPTSQAMSDRVKQRVHDMEELKKENTLYWGRQRANCSN